jgi:hypothetical protein
MGYEPYLNLINLEVWLDENRELELQDDAVEKLEKQLYYPIHLLKDQNPNFLQFKISNVLVSGDLSIVKISDFMHITNIQKIEDKKKEKAFHSLYKICTPLLLIF